MIEYIIDILGYRPDDATLNGLINQIVAEMHWHIEPAEADAMLEQIVRGGVVVGDGTVDWLILQARIRDNASDRELAERFGLSERQVRGTLRAWELRFDQLLVQVRQRPP